MLTLIDSTSLSVEQIAPHWPNIVACLQKFCNRFPMEETPENIINEVMKGERQMWLVLDEEDKVVLVPITAIETLTASGIKQLLLAECGGSRLKEAMALLVDIEQWAKTNHHAERARFVARKGWRDYLEPLGYKAKAVVYEKEL